MKKILSQYNNDDYLHTKIHEIGCSRFVCDECGVRFLSKSSLQQHIDYVHLKTNKYQCAKCQKVRINRFFNLGMVTYSYDSLNIIKIALKRLPGRKSAVKKKN
jgi:hypothetical protein